MLLVMTYHFHGLNVHVNSFAKFTNFSALCVGKKNSYVSWTIFLIVGH